MALVNYRDVLRAARRLTKEKQAELATTIFHDAKKAADKGELEKPAFTPFFGLSQSELQVLSNAMLAPAHQNRLAYLQGRNRDGGITAEEEQELDELLAEIDQLALLKAKADYTLSFFQTKH